MKNDSPGNRKDRLVSWLDAILARSPAQPLFHWRASHQLTILVYHSVDDPARFEEQLNYLMKTMQPVALDQVLRARTNRRGLPKHAVLITFDDGDRSLLEIALPLLRDRGLPAAAFIVAGLLDTNQTYWWDEVEILARSGGVTTKFRGLAPRHLVQALKGISDERRLAALAELRHTATQELPATPQLQRKELRLLESAGLMIGSHTLTHPILSHCSDKKVEHELFRAHEILTSALGHAPQAFAYPNGNPDPRAAGILAELGYEAAFLFDHKLSPWPPPDPFHISRVRVDSTISLDRFRIAASGLHPALHHARGKT